MTPNDIVLAIDVGGTFTDILAFDRSNSAIILGFKVPSTPANPSDAVMKGVDRFLRRSGHTVDAIFHGTTIGTNALITKQGAKTALVTTNGFRDVLALRRHARPRLYDLSPQISPDLVPRERRFEAEERMLANGTALVPLTETEIARIVEIVVKSGAEAVAVCFLHSYANDAHEQALGAAFQSANPDLFVTLSSDVCREFREYERTSTATVNAFIGPPVQRYVDRMVKEMAGRHIHKLSIVKSNGGLTSSGNARRYPVHLIESGPAAGIIACAAMGKAEGINNLIAFDMGGTTAKVGVVINGQPRLETEFAADRFVDGQDVGGYPIQSPVIDLIEIGAGGGSIAWVDAAGVMRVGPESAGADPGPASYGRGGIRPTVTDAHVVVGHVAPDSFGNEDLEIDVAAAHDIILREIAEPMGWTIERAAWGILRLATANMAEMVRLATLRRGLDPRDFSLVAFGGAGPLHASDIAREVGVGRIIVPPMPGLFSAIGTVLGEVRHDLVQTRLSRLSKLTTDDIEEEFHRLELRAGTLIAEEEVKDEWQFERSADLRFEGQLYELTLPVSRHGICNLEKLEASFREQYCETYGYDLPNNIVELVNLRLTVTTMASGPGWPAVDLGETGNKPRTSIQTLEDGSKQDISVICRHDLTLGNTLVGPAIVEDFGATIRVLSGQVLKLQKSGALVLTGRGGGQ